MSWWSGMHDDEGFKEPLFKYWITGERHRLHYGLTDKELHELMKIKDVDKVDEYIDTHGRTDCSICAIIEAQNEGAAWLQVLDFFPGYEPRFCDLVPDDFKLGDRFK